LGCSPSPISPFFAELRLESGVPFHTGLAKQAGASREEVVSAILIGLLAAGNAVTQVLPARSLRTTRHDPAWQ